MNRADFEKLRDLPNKIIVDDIRFSSKRQFSPLLIAEDLKIDNSLGHEARLTIQFNPEIGSKTFNVHIRGIGPICRLDVDGPPHRPCGRTHKHSLQTELCPDRNLPTQVIDRPDLSGLSLTEAFSQFCAMAQIQHTGIFETPSEGGQI